jgi:hypothetical protein
MLLTPQHRRSTRTRRAPKRYEDKQTSMLAQEDEFIVENSEEDDDIYDECPIAPEGFEYNKDYYIASTSYSNFIDNEIKNFKKINKP